MKIAGSSQSPHGKVGTFRVGEALLWARVAEEQKRQLEVIAAVHQLPLSAVIREAIREYLAASEPGPPPPPPQPITLFLRPKDIRALSPDITYHLLRGLRETGSLHPTKHGYPAEEISKVFGLSIELPKPKPFEPPSPLPALLRLRDIRKRFGFCRDLVEVFVKARVIKPFLKCTTAKALYPTWQLLGVLAKTQHSLPAVQPEPAARWLRRRIVMKWLGITPTELESWVQPELIRRIEGYYDKNEIKQKILGLRNV